MADSPKLANCKYENFVVNSSQQKKTGVKGRVDLFLDKFSKTFKKIQSKWTKKYYRNILPKAFY